MLIMKVIIIEDEKPAAEKLQKYLLQAGPDIEVAAVLGSVQESVAWLRQHPAPDLVLMDIELSDGLSFRIFEQAPLSSPVIFTTAYDEYWQEAFEHNSIDYLLKPLKPERLQAALAKYDSLRRHFAENFQQLLQWHRQPEGFKKRFLVKRGADYISIKTEDVAYFYAIHKLVCMVDNRGQKFILDQSLAELEKQLDPAGFYRVSRKYLVSLASIKRIKSLAKGRLQLEAEPPPPDDIIISQEAAGAFKEWMGK
jgi:two-component system, LytTR family, response regulator